MPTCPNCEVPLARARAPVGVYWHCPSCDGRTSTLALLRKTVPPTVVNDLWQRARTGANPRWRPCPDCGNRMVELRAGGGRPERLDVCTVCQLVWFDVGEYEVLPVMAQKPDWQASLPPEARERLALLEIDAIEERSRAERGGGPEEWWQVVPAVLGLPVECDAPPVRRIPWVTWLLAAAAATATGLALADLRATIDAFGLIPAQFARYGGLTFATSFLLHGGLLHLLSNIYFLLVFGDNVEDRLGRWRFLLLIVGAGLAGDIAHILGEPHATVPCVGASGGISGVMALYAFLFPRARVVMLLRLYFLFKWVNLPAYALFGVWVALQFLGAWQQLAGFGQTSYLAHLGGAAVGVLFWACLRGSEAEPAEARYRRGQA